MKLLFTKGNSPLSKMIMWGLKEPCSHLVVLFDDKLTFESNLLGVHVDWLTHVLSNHTIIHTIDLPMNLEQEEKAYQSIIEDNIGKSYDYTGFLYFMWRAFLWRSFNIPFPPKNAWKDLDGMMCVGLASKLPTDLPGLEGLKLIPDTEMISPEKLYQKLQTPQV